MTDISAICNLSAEDREARGRVLRDELAPQAHGREQLPDGVALMFAATPQMRSDLDEFVAFETQCCPSLGFSVRDAPGALRLEITGIDPGASFLDDVGFSGVAAMPGSEQQLQPAAWLRVVRSAGLGAIGAFVLFCVVPIGLVALLGAQLAPLGALDNPWVIGPGALVFAGLLWRWERRREAARAAAGGCGC